MLNRRMAVILCIVMSLLASGLAVSSQAQSRTSENEQAVWKLEHSYWRYVQNNDLPAYLALWNKNFLGWPSVSAAPVHKDHITDWITSETSKGLAFKFIALKPAAIQVTGNIAVTYYWITSEWVAKDGKLAAKFTDRITHTWIKSGDTWQIIGGMSMPEPSR
jgi:type II secretory pathway pseudopilin PulG